MVSEGLWTKKDVAAFLKVDVRTVERLGLPRVPIEVAPGKRPMVRYDPAEVREWVERRKAASRRTAVTSRPRG